VLVDLDPAVEEVAAAAGARAVVADLTEPRASRRSRAAGGDVAVLVNNAGITRRRARTRWEESAFPR